MIGRKPTTDWVLEEDFGALGEMFLRLRAHPGAVETMTDLLIELSVTAERTPAERGNWRL